MCQHQKNKHNHTRRTQKNTQQHTTSRKNAKNKKKVYVRMLNYINQNGSKKHNENHKKNTNLCNSCTHLKTFYSIPSFKSTKRCSIYYCKTDTLHYRQCKYYNNKSKFELIIGW